MNITFMTANLYFNSKKYNCKLLQNKRNLTSFHGYGCGEGFFFIGIVPHSFFYGFSEGNGTSRDTTPEELNCQSKQFVEM